MSKKKRKYKPSRPKLQPTKPAKSEHIKDLVGQTQWTEYVLESDIPVVVDCWAPWCAPCRLMTPILENVARTYEGSVRFAKLNTQANPQIARELNIRSIPTVIIFYKGSVFDVSVGVIRAPILDKMIRRAVDKHQGIGFLNKIRRLWKRQESKAADREAKAGG